MVCTNDQDRPAETLRISGRVEEFAMIIPKRVRLVGPVGTPLHGTISIVPKSSYPFNVTGIRLRRGKNIEAELRSKTGGQGYEVRVVNCRQTTGAYYDTIILTTDSPIQKELMINVYGKIIQKPQRS